MTVSKKHESAREEEEEDDLGFEEMLGHVNRCNTLAYCVTHLCPSLSTAEHFDSWERERDGPRNRVLEEICFF